METNNVDTTKELPTVIAFCAGYGGIERGLELAGLEHRVVAYVEIEAYAIANLVSKMETGQLPPAPIYTDIKTFPSEVFRDRVDIITGGYPCQPFSAAGKRKGGDDPRHLWPYIRKHVETIRPVQCFFENVEGHISLGLNSVISDLEEDGYRTAWGLFSAEEVGAPHQRKRVFIMADSNGNEQRSRLGSGESQRNTTGECFSNGSRVEEPRVVGNAEHDGLLATAQQRSNLQNGNNDTQRQVKAIKSTRASEPRSNRNIQSGKLAHTSCKGLEHSKNNRISENTGQKPNDQFTSRCCSSHPHKFPARPNQEQYDWEHSRVKSRLGGKSNGYSNRVDRLKMLGNGIVPQTAAKAWEILGDRYERSK